MKTCGYDTSKKHIPTQNSYNNIPENTHACNTYIYGCMSVEK